MVFLPIIYCNGNIKKTSTSSQMDKENWTYRSAIIAGVGLTTVITAGFIYSQYYHHKKKSTNHEDINGRSRENDGRGEMSEFELAIYCINRLLLCCKNLMHMFNYFEYNYMYSSKIKLNNEQQLKLYGLFKQAKAGPCNIPKPSILSIQDLAKWNSWNVSYYIHISVQYMIYYYKFSIHTYVELLIIFLF